MRNIYTHILGKSTNNVTNNIYIIVKIIFGDLIKLFV